jgi:multidrug efflux pump
VLAIGIVVDDAIVVVENVERNIELGLSPLDATRQAMKEVTGPIIATALVLCAVFVPTAFIIRAERAVLQAVCHHHRDHRRSSRAFNSLTLSPALWRRAAQATRARKTGFRAGSSISWSLVIPPFNRLFKTEPVYAYVGIVARAPAAPSPYCFTPG